MTAVYIPFIDVYRLLLNHIVSECAAPSVYCDRTVRLLHRAIFHYAAILWDAPPIQTVGYCIFSALGLHITAL